MKSTSRLFVSIVAVLFVAATVCGQEKKEEKADPSGTWRWEHQDPGTGEAVKDVLCINIAKDGKVVGTYQGNDEPIEIEQGTMKDDRLTFQFDLELGQTITIKFDGKVAKDDVEGEVTFETDSDSGSFPWAAKRSVELSDLIGIWNFTVETSDGNTLTPTMTVTKAKDEKSPPKATWKTGGGQDMEVKKLEVKGNNAVFRIFGDFDGNEITVDFKGRPYGDKMNGTLEYDIAGNIGEAEFTSVRKKEAKKDKDTSSTEKDDK